jgi:alpha-N-arabinofuranosidase
MANLAQCINVLQAVILTKEEKMILTPTYHVMEMYNVHQDALLLPLQLTTQKYEFGNDTIDAVNASASKDKNGVIHISLVNVDAVKPQIVKINLDGGSYANVKGRILQSAKLQDYNSFDKPGTIAPKSFTGSTLLANELEVKLPPFSVVVLEIK